MKYQAYVVEEQDGHYQGAVKELETDNLPAGDVLIKVSYSSVNFKDALSNSGNKGVTRSFPHTPGIDAVGQVVADASGTFAEGDSVLVVGYDLGMNTAGGFGEYIRVPKKWVMTLPAGLSPQQAMQWGTAGFTAALCIEKLLHQGVKPEDGAVLVTGATGGVGVVAVMLLSKLGFEVAALTGKSDAEAMLKSAGAKSVLLRDDFIDESPKPMLKPVFAAAVDVAGGKVLETIFKVLNYGGSVAACGLVNSPVLSTSVFPFILRGINFLGVDSVELPLEIKQRVWNKMADEWALPQLEDVSHVITKDQLAGTLAEVLNGGAKGRYVLEH